jgi:hypothetical protein
MRHFQEAGSDVPFDPANGRLRDSGAARICEQIKWAFRCITSDLGGTHRCRTGISKAKGNMPTGL